MKRTMLYIFLAFAMAAVLSACADAAQPESPAPLPSQAASPSDGGEALQAPPDSYVFVSPGGHAVSIDEDMAQVLANLGEPLSYFEAASCAFEGLDKTYTYSGFTIITRPEGADLVTSILLTDDSVTTPEGVYIGCSRADVVAAYGEAASETDTLLSYSKDGTALNFILADGAVISIEYLPG